MRKVLPIKIEFEYEESKDNAEIIQRMYNRIFEMAKQNILNKRKLKRGEVKTENEKLLHICSSIIRRPIFSKYTASIE